MIKCLIVEDEILAQQVIQKHLERINQLELSGICQNALEAKEFLLVNDVDLIFLDLQLPGMMGLHFLQTIPNPPLIIITTAFSEYALESYEFNVIDYLLKPISFERFAKAIQKVTQGRLYAQPTPEAENWGDHLFIKSGSKFFRIDYKEIMYVQSMKDYLKIHTREHKLVTHQTMNEFERLLPARQFIRVHKSYIVAVNHIKIIYGNSIEVDGLTIPVGNSYKNNVMNLIGKKN